MLAEEAKVLCFPQADGKSYKPGLPNGQLLGGQGFGAKEACQQAIAPASRGYICIPGPEPGQAIAYSLQYGWVVGEHGFRHLADCTESIDGIKNDLICTASAKAPAGIYDLRRSRFVERYYRNTFGSCLAALGSKEVEKAREEKLKPGEVQGCNDVRLDAPGGSMEHVAVRDQGDVPICFAEVAAQMTDAWRFTHGDTRYSFQTSALIAALQSQNAPGQVGLDRFGHEQAALAAIQKYGSCSKSATLEELGGQELYRLVELLRSMKQGIASDAVVALKRYFDAPYCVGERGYLASFDSVLRTVESAEPDALFSRLFSVSCKGKNHLAVNPPPMIYHTVMIDSPRVIANHLAGLLKSARSLPASVSVCMELFRDPGYRPIFGTESQPVLDSCQGERHSLLLIGKRTNKETGRCEFLLRNSWGMECGQARKSWGCESGNSWIDADALARNVVQIGTFEEQGK